MWEAWRADEDATITKRRGKGKSWNGVAKQLPHRYRGTAITRWQALGNAKRRRRCWVTKHNHVMH